MLWRALLPAVEGEPRDGSVVVLVKVLFLVGVEI